MNRKPVSLLFSRSSGAALFLALVPALLGTAVPAAGQEVRTGATAPDRIAVDVPQVRSGRFVLVGNSLTIQVQADVPGMVQVVRGRWGRVEVQARSDGGLPGFAMTQQGWPRLHLTGVGADQLTYVVVVPPRAMVLVNLPDRARPESVGTGAASAIFRWEAPDPEEAGSG